MDARAKRISEILHTGDQYRVPFFQRSYSWQRKEWSRLWDDVVDLSDNDVRREHFMGSLVCTPLPHRPGEVNGYQLIDGQQRLTTLSILLAALADVLAEEGDDEAAAVIREDFLVHRRRKGDDRYKVLPRPGDKEVLAGLIDGREDASAGDERIAAAYRYFRKQVAEIGSEEGAESIDKIAAIVTGCLQIVVITIDDDEDPYEIFESLNSTGLPLGEADLVRNYVFMKVPADEQEAFDTNQWSPLEAFFESHSRGASRALEDFYRAYLGSRVGYIKRGRTYATFRDQFEERRLEPRGAAEELHRYLGYERLLTGDPALESPFDRTVIEDFVEMDARTAVPLFFALLEGVADEKWSAARAEGALRQVNSFLLRRALCRESTKAYNSWFANAVAELAESGVESLERYLMGRGWPDDAALAREVLTFPVYQREPQKARRLLLRIEGQVKSKEPVDPAKLTLEHVMPQSIGGGERGKKWKAMLGEDWKEVHASLLHTLGNLTLSGYNSELGNRSYEEKQVELKESRLGLNEHFSGVDVWDGDAIEARAEILGRKVAELWPRPEGLPYLPGQRSAQKLSKAKREELFLEFWSGVIERLAEHSDSWGEKAPSKGRPVQLKTDHRSFRWNLYAVSGYLGVSVTIKGAHADEHLEALSRSAASIEDQLGYGLDWESGNDKGAQRNVSLARSDFSLTEPERWPVQQEWLVERLVELEEVFAPFFQELEPVVQPTGHGSRELWVSRVGLACLEPWDRVVAEVSERSGLELHVRYGLWFLVVHHEGQRRVAFRGWPRTTHLTLHLRTKDNPAALERLSRYDLEARINGPAVRLRLNLDAAPAVFEAVVDEICELLS